MADETTPTPPDLVRFLNASTIHFETDQGPRFHTTATADDGTIWERRSDWPEGRWARIEAPPRP